MGLVINHNLMAMNAARNLTTIYKSLAKSTAALSSGLRVMSAADDAAGLAVRELMRADIAVLNQGMRNASDAISLIQTAEGALGVVDEKLIRMRELAEQAATGTYTTSQRAIMNSEYQAMAAELDRTARATDFNNVKLLDGSLAALHGGSGLKIHFGTGNSSAEDYYYIKVEDMRATPTTGLGVGTTETTNVDVWYNDNVYLGAANCAVSTTNGYLFFAYDYDASRTTGSAVSTELGNIVGMYQVASAATESGAFGLNALVDAINQGTAARVAINFDYSDPVQAGSSLAEAFNITCAAPMHFSMGDVKIALYQSATDFVDSDADISIDAGTPTVADFMETITSAINTADGNVFAVWDNTSSGNAVMVFAKEAGAAGNGYQAWEDASATGVTFKFIGDNITTTSAAGGITEGTFSGGGASWVTASVTTDDDGRYRLRIDGNATGAGHDMMFYEAADATDYNGGGICGASTWIGALTAYDDSAASEWIQLTDSSGVSGFLSDPGKTILTQSAAQLALGQITLAINSKDNARANLGALQNRLENTITQIAIQAENLQAAESRISDIDVALEMTEFTKNMILAQAATSMLAQANGVAQLALSVLG